jgi:hypothetical protein
VCLGSRLAHPAGNETDVGFCTRGGVPAQVFDRICVSVRTVIEVLILGVAIPYVILPMAAPIKWTPSQWLEVAEQFSAAERLESAHPAGYRESEDMMVAGRTSHVLDDAGVLKHLEGVTESSGDSIPLEGGTPMEGDPATGLFNGLVAASVIWLLLLGVACIMF